MVFQHFNLFNNKTVLQNIMLAPVHLKCKDLKKAKRKNLFGGGKKEPITQTKEQIKSEARDHAMELLKRIGLEDKADVYPSTLSGGQKQRIAIIRSLAMDPDVMLFDEPTSALDPETTNEVIVTIQKLVARAVTMLIVTHDMRFARDSASRVLFMDEGKILEENTPEKLFECPESPRLRAFLQSIH